MGFYHCSLNAFRLAGAGSLTRGKVKHALKSQGSSEMNVLYIYIGTALTPFSSSWPFEWSVTCFSFSLNAAMSLCDDWLSELRENSGHRVMKQVVMKLH